MTQKGGLKLQYNLCGELPFPAAQQLQHRRQKRCEMVPITWAFGAPFSHWLAAFYLFGLACAFQRRMTAPFAVQAAAPPAVQRSLL